PAAARVHFIAQTSMLSTICEARFDASILAFSQSASVFVPMYSTGNRRNAEAASPDRPSALLTNWRRFYLARWQPTSTALPLSEACLSTFLEEHPRRPPRYVRNLGMTLIGTSVTDWTRWLPETDCASVPALLRG